MNLMSHSSSQLLRLQLPRREEVAEEPRSGAREKTTWELGMFQDLLPQVVRSFWMGGPEGSSYRVAVLTHSLSLSLSLSAV